MARRRGVLMKGQDIGQANAPAEVVPRVAGYDVEPRELPGVPASCSNAQLFVVSRSADAFALEGMLAVAPPPEAVVTEEPPDLLPPCPCCGGRMRIIETFERWMQPRAPPRHPAATGAPL